MENILLELSYFDLSGRTNQAFGNERQKESNRVQIPNGIVYIPMMSNNALRIAAKTTTDNEPTYNTRVLFENLNYTDEDTSDTFTFKGTDGSMYYIIKPPKSLDVKVNCSCLDFYYRFALWDSGFKSLDGDAPPPYIKKTDSAPVNPTRTPGVCKHIMALMDRINSEHFYQ